MNHPKALFALLPLYLELQASGTALILGAAGIRYCPYTWSWRHKVLPTYLELQA